MRDDAHVDALQQALLTALTTDSDVPDATRALAPEWTEQMQDDAINIARKLAKRWCRTESEDRG
jgi:hypothetical protein